jgi:hypothetical protein
MRPERHERVVEPHAVVVTTPTYPPRGGREGTGDGWDPCVVFQHTPAGGRGGRMGGPAGGPAGGVDVVGAAGGAAGGIGVDVAGLESLLWSGTGRESTDGHDGSDDGSDDDGRRNRGTSATLGCSVGALVVRRRRLLHPGASAERRRADCRQAGELRVHRYGP